MYRTGALLLFIAIKIEFCMIQGSTESKINCAQYNQGTEITATVNTSIYSQNTNCVKTECMKSFVGIILASQHM